MSKLDTQNINVLNYNENEVYVDSAKEHYKFSASRDGITPSVIPISLSELQNICTNTNIFLTGWLTFDDDVKEEVFNMLRVPNWKNILSNKDIEDILIHPTLEGLQRIIAIDNATYFDRVRIIMHRLISSGADITSKVTRIVEQRYNEIKNRQRVSSIILTKKDTQYATPNDVKALSEQNAYLQNQLDEMKKMMEQMMSMQNHTIVQDQEASDNSEYKETANEHKKPGRPKKTMNQ